MRWRNVRYASGYAEALVGSDRLHLVTSELDQSDRYHRNIVFETPRKNRILASRALETALANPRIMAELLPMATSFGRKDTATPSNEAPGETSKKGATGRREQKPNPGRTVSNKNERVERALREF